jgi:hypothetical protein
MVELDDEKESGKKKTRKGVGRGGGADGMCTYIYRY